MEFDVSVRGISWKFGILGSSLYLLADSLYAGTVILYTGDNINYGLHCGKSLQIGNSDHKGQHHLFTALGHRNSDSLDRNGLGIFTMTWILSCMQQFSRNS